MVKIYLMKFETIFLNVISILMTILIVILSILSKEYKILYLLFLSVSFYGLSILFKFNQIVMDDVIIYIKIPLLKNKINISEIQEVCIEDFIRGYAVTFNLQCVLKNADLKNNKYYKYCKKNKIQKVYSIMFHNKNHVIKLLNYLNDVKDHNNFCINNKSYSIANN